MMEILTDYAYTSDATSDAGGATETFGAEAGYGIIAAKKISLWVAKNCPATCPSECSTLHIHIPGLSRCPSAPSVGGSYMEIGDQKGCRSIREVAGTSSCVGKYRRAGKKK